MPPGLPPPERCLRLTLNLRLDCRITFFLLRIGLPFYPLGVPAWTRTGFFGATTECQVHSGTSGVPHAGPSPVLTLRSRLITSRWSTLVRWGIWPAANWTKYDLGTHNCVEICFVILPQNVLCQRCLSICKNCNNQAHPGKLSKPSIDTRKHKDIHF